uniref:Senescence domain-containing protein n=1 Tax=Oryza meridionalis TaxID=40149 RepID=A0A0E0C7D8_9ORYZ
MTEKMSQSLLDTVIAVTGSMAAPLLRSKQGKAFLASVPGEVILASLDAINKVMDAVEAAERRSLAATSNVVSGAVSRRYGESAGEATEDAFATAGHAAVTPSSSLPGNMKAVTPSSSRRPPSRGTW